jgi:hypothetical protein
VVLGALLQERVVVAVQIQQEVLGLMAAMVAMEQRHLFLAHLRHMLAAAVVVLLI